LTCAEADIDSSPIGRQRRSYYGDTKKRRREEDRRRFRRTTDREEEGGRPIGGRSIFSCQSAVVVDEVVSASARASAGPWSGRSTEPERGEVEHDQRSQ
jgi:hypothetical protein